MDAWDRRSPRRSREDPGFAIDRDHGDVLVDFSAPAALEASLDRALSAGIPILVGTTGLDELDQPADRRGRQAASRCSRRRTPRSAWPAAPTSSSAPRACSAQSGTWKSPRPITATKPTLRRAPRCMLGQAAARGRGTELKAERGRDGTGLTREAGAIGFASLRGGTVAGDHDVLFLGPERAADPVASRRKPDDLRPRSARRRALPRRQAGRASTRCATSSALREREPASSRTGSLAGLVCSTRPCWSWAGSSAPEFSSTRPRSRVTSTRRH